MARTALRFPIRLNRALALKFAVEDAGAPEAEADSRLPSDPMEFLRSFDDAVIEARSALAFLERETERSQEVLQAKPEEPRSEKGKAVVAAGLALVSAYLWFGQPAWLQPPEEPAATPQEQDQGRALALRLTAGQVEEFRTRTGRLPTSLDEVGPILPDIDYRDDGNGIFSLEVPGATAPLRLDSRDTVAGLPPGLALDGRSP